MRGFQLSAIARRGVPEAEAVNYISLESAFVVSSSLLFLTPSMTKHATPKELERLRKAGNTLCFDFLDYPPNDQLIDDCDVLISSSFRQHQYFSATFPKNIVHMITHHVDPEIDFVPGAFDRTKIAYFGEIGNARHRSELTDYISFHQTNNSENSDRKWLTELRDYNCHYSIREYRFPFRNPPPNAFKPFTKGFTAARCAANLIVDRDESDALLYLGADYPYLLADNELSTVRTGLEYAIESFGSKDWNFALDVMRHVESRSSVAHIAGELKNLISRLRNE